VCDHLGRITLLAWRGAGDADGNRDTGTREVVRMEFVQVSRCFKNGFAHVSRASRVSAWEDGHKFSTPDLLHRIARAIAMHSKGARKVLQPSLGRLAPRVRRNTLQVIDFDRQHAEGLRFAGTMSPRRIQRLSEPGAARKVARP